MKNSLVTPALSAKENGETGLLIVVGLVAFGIAHPRSVALPLAMVVGLATLLIPSLLLPATLVWKKAGHWFGLVSSTIVLVLLFFLLVCPFAFIRRACGADPMKKKKWKKGNQSMLAERTHTFTPADLKHTF